MPELASIVRASSRRLLLLEDEELVESMVRVALGGTGIELGEPDAARQAAELEVAALGGDVFAANHCWPLLHQQLLALEPTL